MGLITRSRWALSLPWTSPARWARSQESWLPSNSRCLWRPCWSARFQTHSSSSWQSGMQSTIMHRSRSGNSNRQQNLWTNGWQGHILKAAAGCSVRNRMNSGCTSLRCIPRWIAWPNGISVAICLWQVTNSLIPPYRGMLWNRSSEIPWMKISPARKSWRNCKNPSSRSLSSLIVPGRNVASGAGGTCSVIMFFALIPLLMFASLRQEPCFWMRGVFQISRSLQPS